MKLLNALIAARPFVEDGMTICAALYYAGARGYQPHIMKQLYPKHYYDDWVRAYHPEAYIQMLRTPGAFKQGRLQWLDHMIKEL